MKKLVCSFGLGLFALFVAGHAGAGDETKSTEQGVNKFVPVQRPDRQTRLEIIKIVRAAGSRDHKVRTEAIRDWYGQRRENAYLPLVTGLTFSASRSRVFSAFALGEIGVPNAIAPLSRRALVDENSSVRRAAVDSIRKLSAGRKGLDPLPRFTRALRSSHTVTRVYAAQALGNLGDRRAIPHLIQTFDTIGGPSSRVNIFSGRQISYIRGYDVEVATGASIAKPNVGLITEGTVLDTRIIRTQSRTLVFWRTVVHSLEKLSGQRLGKDPAAWRRWYASRKPSAVSASATARVK